MDCRFWTVQNSASSTDWRPIARINMFLPQLAPFLHDPYVIREQIALTHNPSKSRKTPQESGLFVIHTHSFRLACVTGP